MWAFMTTGTARFLKDITDSHPTIDFYFMKRAASTLVYYEDKRKKGVFVSGRSFSILSKYGVLKKEGFVVMNNIPIMEDGSAVFEDQVKKKLPLIENTEGLNAIRLLKQAKKNHYMVLTQWKTERHYTTWQKSERFKQMDFVNMARLPAYFAERPYSASYYMMKEE